MSCVSSTAHTLCWLCEAQNVRTLFSLTVPFLLCLCVTRDSQTPLLAETSVSAGRGGREEQWFCERRLHYLDARLGLRHLQESLPARPTGVALCRGPARRELHLPYCLQYPFGSPTAARELQGGEVNRICVGSWQRQHGEPPCVSRAL